MSDLLDFVLARVTDDARAQLSDLPDVPAALILNTMVSIHVEMSAAAQRVGVGLLGILVPGYLKARAAQWSEHPEYQQEWRP